MKLIRTGARLPRRAIDRADRSLPSGRSRSLLAAFTALLAAGAVVATSALTFSAVDAVRTERAKREAVPSVQELTPRLLNFDFRTIDADLDRAKSVTTGDYWGQNELGDTLKPAVLAEEASTRTVVRSAGVERARPDRVVVLVYLNQTTEGKSLSAPRVDSRVARVTAAKTGDRWLLAAFEPL
ncbi:hypothetical protein IQ251_02535 [Saccharopolyspora sp. HNM0983]|uniref:Mce-associated membrane protein n=1 Tax=Saccharopolyspora montiporae TaxID=2781240 RepID=A0A929B7M4_9PSEU|nr:hypothetical protein [Saccharopolyspora sp. HNM0983]MBE9373315.1 hypothetical protein [Saccharopolyspora sp. HNM0983]